MLHSGLPGEIPARSASPALYGGISQKSYVEAKKSDPDSKTALESAELFDEPDSFEKGNNYEIAGSMPKNFQEKQAFIQRHNKKWRGFDSNNTEPKTTEVKVNDNQADTQNPISLTILHTNDLHGNLDPNSGKGGMAYVAGKVKQLRDKNPSSILLDAGDISYAPPYSDRNRFNPMPEIMNKIGYNTLGAGNHEFQWEAGIYGGPNGNPNPNLTDNMKELAGDLKFPMVCANAVSESSGKRPDFLKPYMIQNIGGVNVGVTSVVTSNLATSAHPQVGDNWLIKDQSDSLKQIIPEMKANGADVIVVLSHDNLKRNQGLIRSTPGIDVLIGSHDHQTTQTPIVVKDPQGKNVPLVEAGGYGYNVGEMKLDLDPSSKKLTKATSTMYPVTMSNTKPDPEIAQIVNRWERE